MNNFGKFASAIVAAVALFLLGVFAFVWGFCRVCTLQKPYNCKRGLIKLYE